VTSLCQLKQTRRNGFGPDLPARPCHQRLPRARAIADTRAKYKSGARRDQLLGCLRLIAVEAFFKDLFRLSIFTGLARGCGFS